MVCVYICTQRLWPNPVRYVPCSKGATTRTGTLYGNLIGAVPGTHADLLIPTHVQLWRDAYGYDRGLAAVTDSVSRMGLPYIDLMLLHSPGSDPLGRAEAWQALEEAVRQVGEHPTVQCVLNT